MVSFYSLAVRKLVVVCRSLPLLYFVFCFVNVGAHSIKNLDRSHSTGCEAGGWWVSDVDKNKSNVIDI